MIFSAQTQFGTDSAKPEPARTGSTAQAGVS